MTNQTPKPDFHPVRGVEVATTPLIRTGPALANRLLSMLDTDPALKAKFTDRESLVLFNNRYIHALLMARSTKNFYREMKLFSANIRNMESLRVYANVSETLDLAMGDALTTFMTVGAVVQNWLREHGKHIFATESVVIEGQTWFKFALVEMPTTSINVDALPQPLVSKMAAETRDQLIGMIDPDKYVSPQRQDELIQVASIGPASAIRLAIREAVYGYTTGQPVPPTMPQKD